MADVRVQLSRRDDPKYGELWDLTHEDRVVCSRPSEAAARKAAADYGWAIEDRAEAGEASE